MSIESFLTRRYRRWTRVTLAATLLLWARSGLAHPRFGLVVSRKVGNAVVRNRVKRWLREVVRRAPVPKVGVDVVLIARWSSANAGLDALEADVTKVLRHLPGERGT